MMYIDSKILGYVILANAFLIMFIIFLFNEAIAKIAQNNCVHGLSCPMYEAFNVQRGISIFISLILSIIGLFLIFFNENKIKRAVKISNENMKEEFIKEKSEIIKRLSEDERAVFDKIINADGVIFQSNLIKESGFSKVKITRILDKLEANDLIERKRRGMGNIIVLKK
mgnify:CR=1 FL=1